MADTTITNSADGENRYPPLAQAVFEDRPELVSQAVAGGADPNGIYGSMTYLQLATLHGRRSVIKALIAAGAAVPSDALLPLGEMDVTDWMIDPIELERPYAEVLRLLLEHGAEPDVRAYNGSPLISTFPSQSYPTIHRVLADALSTPKNRNA